MREQVITQRAGRGGTSQSKGRGASGGGQQQQVAQRPASRRARTSSGTARKGGALRASLRFAPLVAKLLVAACVGVLVFAGYRAAASASFFKLKAVEVEGTSRVSRDEVKAAVERAVTPHGVWNADLEALSGDLRELPWVRAAYVQRVLPSGVRVRVVEREPRLVARTSSGRLVWVDDDGVVLGTASAASAGDFIIRGLDEARTPEARQGNRGRVAAALAMKREWEKDGLAERVSEVNLDDLRDVRVQLAGDDSRIEVRLGREEYVARFRDALRKLDAQRDTPLGSHVIYIDVTTGKNAIFGYPQEIRASDLRPQQVGDSNAAPEENTAARNERSAPPKRDARPQDSPPQGKKKDAKRDEKREAVIGKPAVAVRERRVG